MTREAAKNLPASIRESLLALAQNKGEDYQRILGRFAIERILYRLGRSKGDFYQLCSAVSKPMDLDTVGTPYARRSRGNRTCQGKNLPRGFEKVRPT
jgi:hypothetical protein